MSENDNLQDADGKKEVELQNNAPHEESAPQVEETTEVKNEIETAEDSDNEPKVDADAHSEIEASNAEDAEDESNAERHEVEEKDYHAMSMQDLAEELNRLLKHHKIQTISKQVNEIKSEFNAK